MKKPLAIFMSAGLLLSGLAIEIPAVQAAELPKDKQKNAREEPVLTLTIDEVVERAVANDRNIIVLGYQYEMLKSQKEMTYDNIDELEEKIDKAESDLDSIPIQEEIVRHSILLGFQEALAGRTYEELLPNDPLKLEIDAATQKQVMENISKKDGLRDDVKLVTDNISDSIDDLKSGLKQNEISNTKLQLQVEETKEGIRFMMKGRYMELLSVKEGLALQSSFINSLKVDLNKAQQEKDMGVVSYNNVVLLKRDLKKQENDLVKKQKNYELELKKLLLDLGYALTLKVELTHPDFDQLKKIDTSKFQETKEKFLTNSYELKKIEQDITKLEYDGKKLADKDKDKKENANVKYLEKMNLQELNMKLEEKKKIEQDITKHITSIFDKAEEAYESIQEKTRLKENEKEDELKLALQYELGLISKHDYEKASMLYRQASFDELMAKVAFYLKLEELAVVEKGLLLTQ